MFKKIERLIRKKFFKKKPPRFERQRLRFLRRYPDYQIGHGTYGIPQVWDLHEGTTLAIGSYCSISANVQIFLGGQHRTDWISTYPFSAYLENIDPIPDTGISKGNVIIGNDVWICANVIILSGVTIGDGAVLANGAIVTRDVSPYAIVAGNPARLIRHRFDEPLRRQLLEIKWWGWPVDEVKSLYALLNSNQLDALIEYAKNRDSTL